MRNKVYLSKPHKKKFCQCQSVILATLVSKLKLCTVNVTIVMQSIMKIAKTLTKPCHGQFSPSSIHNHVGFPKQFSFGCMLWECNPFNNPFKALAVTIELALPLT